MINITHMLLHMTHMLLHMTHMLLHMTDKYNTYITAHDR
jgi:hypothetical protein